MISEPSARISWWSRPTALCSASSERKLFEQTISASRSVSCAGVVSPPPRISLRRTRRPASASCQAASLPASPPPMMWMSKDMPVIATSIHAGLDRIHFSRGKASRSARDDGGLCVSSPLAMRARRWPSSSPRFARRGVKRVIDVRALPLSRRPGFSKTALRGALDRGGHRICPFEGARHARRRARGGAGRAACRHGTHLCRAARAARSDGPIGAKCWSSRREKPSALLCLEREPAHCHRTLVARKRSRADAEIIDLFA